MKILSRRAYRRTDRNQPLRFARGDLESLEPRCLLTQVGGDIVGDTVWTLADSPYEVTSDVRVLRDATLQIEPGVVVEFAASARLEVRGQLLADGTADARIRFQPSDPRQRWEGLKFEDTLADN